jgi:hypothetical protein
MDIIKKVTKNAERLLKSLKANYYIELPTGEEISHGLDGFELVPSEEEKPQRKKREMRSGQPFGAQAKYFRPFLENCKAPGDVAVVPLADWDGHILRSSIAAHCSTYWGKATYVTTLNREKKQVEVMRTAPNSLKAKGAKGAKSKIEAQSKVNGSQEPKFKSLGHGMDALRNLEFDDEHHAQR